MRNRRNKAVSLVLLTMVIYIWLSAMALADDNEIFGVVTQTVEPNVLIVFDTSGSMKGIVPSGATWTPTYESGTTYREYDYWGDSAGWIDDNEIILNEDNNGDGDWDYQDTEDDVRMYLNDNWDTRLTTDRIEDYSDSTQVRYELRGSWEYTTLSEFKDQLTNLRAGGWVTIDGYPFAVGNWINWHKSRNETAIHAIQNIIDQHGGGLRFGIMRFDGSTHEGGYILPYDSTQISCSLKDSYILDGNGDPKTGTAYDTAIADYKTDMKNAVDSLPASGNTPLTETLAEAGLYFAEKDSWFNGGSYANIEHYPMQYRCRQNYIIVMTDGVPTSDTNSLLYTGLYINGDQIRPGDGNCALLYHVSEYLYENDCNSSLDGQQNVVTYTIGFLGGDPNLLQTTADKGQGAASGQGLYFPANNQESLEGAFQAFVANINERKTTFTASVVPISDVNKAYAGDSVYMSLFQPISGSSRWVGNLKKYKLDSNNEFASCDDGQPILDSSGGIKETARSCWSGNDDGGDVSSGGAGELLSNMVDSNRNIYTNIDTSVGLTASGNEFSVGNSALLSSPFSLDASTINAVRMVDEDWKLGDLNHSKPAVTTYGSSSHYVFVGSNDGMLHCFNDADGSEKWAFIAAEQLNRITDTFTGDHSYFMDGSPTVADTSSNEKILMVGERRGGNHYYTLNVTDIDNPSYLYTHTTDGQSWAKPKFMTVKTSSGTEEVFLLTGGYDAAYDSSDNVANPVGNSVFMIEAVNGNSVELFDDLDLPAMTNPIVSAFGVDMVDDGKNIISEIYAGDLEGKVFAFRDNDDPSAPKQLDGSWQAMHLFVATSSGKKMFGEVDFAPEFIQYYDQSTSFWETVVGDYVFFGTGDRANPLRTDNTNYFYCVKNDWHTGEITVGKKVADFATLDDDLTGDPDNTDNDLVMIDVTDNKIQDGTDVEKRAVRDALNKKYNRGWHIALEGIGEKCLSTPVVYSGVVYFTTFTPADASSGATSSDPCEDPSTGGTAKLYALDYKTGASVFNFSTDNDTTEPTLGKEDRYKVLDQYNITIAPNPLLIITDKGEKLAIGPHTENVKSPKAGVNMFYWIEDN